MAVGLFPEARPRGKPFIVGDGQEARGDTAAPRRPLASSTLAPDYGDELWDLATQETYDGNV
jgi:hypothetical protein